MKKILVLLCGLTSLFTYSQINFEPGYYIDNEGRKIEGFIKNEDWLNDPRQIHFKSNLNEEVIILTIEDVSFFEVENLKYKRAKIKYDIDYSEASVPSEQKVPNYKEKTVFLHLLVSGKASLYKLGSQNRFYYSLDHLKIDHLVYKPYVFKPGANKKGKIIANETYKSQLYDDLRCNDINIIDIQNLSFNDKKLMQIFEKYNDCIGDSQYVYKEPRRKKIFHLQLKSGIRYTNLETNNSMNSIQNIDYGWSVGFAGTIELEYVMPFKKNKWSTFVEFTFQNYKSEISNQKFNPTSDYYFSMAHYQSLEFNLGIRYYMFLSEKSVFYLNPKLTLFDFPFNSQVNNFEVRSIYSFYAGIGYIYNNKFGVKIGISTNREILGDYVYLSGKYKYIDLMLSYRIF